MQAPNDQTRRSAPGPESAASRPRPAAWSLPRARRVGIAVVGRRALVGIVFLVTPGPAFVVIPVGLGILALEFEWRRAGSSRSKTA